MLGIDSGWIWAIAGVVLLIAEIVAPGVFLLFIGAAAIATGLFTEALGLGAVGQTILFAMFAAMSVALGRRWYAQSARRRDPLLSDRAARLVGQVVEAVDPVDDHGGRVRVADGEWTARGGPAAPGEKVRIVGIDGNCLNVIRLAPAPIASTRPGSDPVKE